MVGLNHQNSKTTTQICFLDKASAKFVRERIASRSWDTTFPIFQALMIVSILSELEKSGDSTRQTQLKTVCGEGIDNPGLHKKVQSLCRTVLHELQEFVSKQTYNKLRRKLQNFLIYA